MNQQVSQRISNLETALNDYPQGRLFQLLKYAMVVLNLLLGCIFLLLLYVFFFAPTPTPEQAFYFLHVAIFLPLYFLILRLQGLRHEAVMFWRLRVRISVILICSLGQLITENQRDRLYTLMNSKKKELDLAFEGCDEPTRQTYQRLIEISGV